MTLRSLLFLGASLLTLLPAAKAQLTFTVNEFTSDKLSLTINAGTLLTTGGADKNRILFLVDGDGTNTSWVNHTQSASSGGAPFGSASFSHADAHDDDWLGDLIIFAWESNLSAAGNLTNNLTFEFNFAGLFNPDNVDTWALYWGDPIYSTFTLQSMGSAITGGGSAPLSAVPEPSTYAALAGLAALGFAAWRRRRATSPATVCSA